MDQYALYLRKSRADLDAESRGEGETLAKHRAALTEYARRRGLLIVREYAEIISGDSIAARPQMQQLLEDVKAGLYAGVIVNDVDRLGRGDSIDQEIIKRTFAIARCLIITPSGDIDPASSRDEDMLDFRMFFARMELRKISQRLSVGRARSAMSGNYVAPRVPYGYTKVRDGRRITLVPDAKTAPIVRMIFDWYASGSVGYDKIAHRLNDMGLKTSLGNIWRRASVRSVLRNEIYIGRAVWGRFRSVSDIRDGQRVKRIIKTGAASVAEGKYPAIVPRDLFDRVQAMFVASRSAAPVTIGNELSNPLAGLLRCAQCGRMMEARSVRNTHTAICRTPGCPTHGTYIPVILDATLDILSGWCATYADPAPEPMQDANVEKRAALHRQLDGVAGQLARAQELVETGVYSPAEYLARKNALEDRQKAIRAELDALAPATSTGAAIHAIIPAVRHVLDVFYNADNPEAQNVLLKSVVDHIDYTKTKAGTRSVDPASLLSLDVFPRIGCSM